VNHLKPCTFLLLLIATTTISADDLVVSQSVGATGATDFQLVVLKDGAGFGDLLSGEIRKTYPRPYANTVSAGGSISWKQYRQKTTPEGIIHEFYEQRYTPDPGSFRFEDGVPSDGFKISGGYLANHSAGASAPYLVSGTIFEDITKIRTPTITNAEDAVFSAAESVDATGQLTVAFHRYGNQEIIDSMKEQSELWLHPVKDGLNFGFAWHVPVLSSDGAMIPVVVDAESGAVLAVSESPRWDVACNPQVSGPGFVTVVGTPQRTGLGAFNLSGTPSSAGGWECVDAHVDATAVTPSIQILRGSKDNPCAAGLWYTQTYGICTNGTGSPVYDNVEVNINPIWGPVYQCTPGRAVTDALRHAQTTFDVFWGVLGRQGISGSGEDFRVIVDARCRPEEDEWGAQFERFGRINAPAGSVRVCGRDQDPPENATPMGCDFYDTLTQHSVALDIMAHEIGHGVIFNTTGMDYVYAGIEGELHEGFADVIGHGVEWMQPSPRAGEEPDWEGGEDTGQADRRVDVDEGTHRFFYSDTVHIGTPHSRGTPLPVAMRLLSEGGTNPACVYGGPHNRPNPDDLCDVSVGSLGVQTAFKIYYKMLDDYVVPSTTWYHLRGDIIAAAGDLEGYTATPIIGSHAGAAPWCLGYSEYRYKASRSFAAIDLPGNIPFCPNSPD